MSKTTPRPKPINPRKLVLVADGSSSAQVAYMDRQNGLVVQIWENATPGCEGTDWQGTLRVAIKYTSGRTQAQVLQRRFAKPITWDDMQAIKDHFWPDRIALEVFPPHDRIVDAADMRWMWVLPKGAAIPFNLESTSTRRLSS